MMNCPGCLKTNTKGFCTKCRKELFDGKKVSEILTFNSPYSEPSELFLNHTKKISISGVQIKYLLRLEEKQLQLTDTGGQYLLKPIPTGQFKNLDQVPANEHLTMQIARQVYGLSIPANGVIFFKDGSPAYLVKRFDRNADGKKIQQEDFAQIAQMTAESHGQNYKYDLSYEEIGELIKKYVSAYLIEVEKFFRLILLNYIFSNGDAHLKNFSVMQTIQGDYILTPGYDLICTRLHVPSESDMALSLFKDGFSEKYKAYGFYTYEDFYLFGLKLGIRPGRIEKFINEFSIERESAIILVNHSFLKEDLKQDYLRYYMDKISRLKMR